jgi:hypothetical protein
MSQNLLGSIYLYVCVCEYIYKYTYTRICWRKKLEGSGTSLSRLFSHGTASNAHANTRVPTANSDMPIAAFSVAASMKGLRVFFLIFFQKKKPSLCGQRDRQRENRRNPDRDARETERQRDKETEKHGAEKDRAPALIVDSHDRDLLRSLDEEHNRIQQRRLEFNFGVQAFASVSPEA